VADAVAEGAAPVRAAQVAAAAIIVRPPRPFAPSAAELERHAAFIATLDNPLWLDTPPP